METGLRDSGRQFGSTLISFMFLAMLAFNAIAITDLFLSVLSSPPTLILLQSALMLAILVFLAAQSLRNPELGDRGWFFILAGFSLLLLGGLAELLALIPAAGGAFRWLEAPATGFLARILFQLSGCFCLAYGFMLWLPAVIQARRSAEENAARLEAMVRERTGSLEQSNRRLTASKLRLEEEIRLRGEFLASFSHELKTPLNSILGFSRLLAEGRQGELSERQQRSLGIIYANSRALLERIERILDLARFEFDEVEPRPQEVPLTDLLEEITELARPLLQDKPVQLTLELQDGPGAVRADPELLSRLVLGLLDNAIKFTDSGTVTVRAGRASGQEGWFLAVADTGQGIRREDLPRVFEAFRQGDGSLSRRHPGTGLGLAIVRRLCRLLRATIEVESTPGLGSTFTLRFPDNPDTLPPREEPVLALEPTGEHPDQHEEE